MCALSPSIPSSNGSRPPHPSTLPIEAQTRLELVRLAFAELAVATWISVAVTLAFGVALSSIVDRTTLVSWLGFMLAVLGYALWLAAAFRARRPDADTAGRWAFQLVVATTLNALGWGVTAWIFPTLMPGTPLGLAHGLILAGLATSATRLLLPIRKGSIAYILALMLPVATRFVAEQNGLGLALAFCVLLFIAFIGYSTMSSHRALSEALALRFEREALAAALSTENAQREMREAELREARARAEQASRAKGEFLATISHEIRTPMNGVLGMLRVVRDTELSSDQRTYLKTAADSAESLLLLLNDVLDFSKIEAGRLELEHAAFAPVTIAKAVTDLLHARARDKGLLLELRLADNLPGAIIGDSGRLRQILVNLIGNAIKFTERGRVELALTCSERTATNATLQFTVTDTGIGMDSAALEKLFRPFTQADTSMSRRYGGTGLGLAISMRLAQAMGGAIQVSSTLNRGSTFRLMLPCQLPETTMAPRENAPKFVTPLLNGRVLVVEDDSVNRQVIELFLKKMNVTPAFACDGEAAIASATAGQAFDVVLMDCQLPGIDGLETTRRIRQKLGPTPMTIIALTANASTHVREACLAAGMNDFLTKPVRFELLAAVLQRYLPPAAVLQPAGKQ